MKTFPQHLQRHVCCIFIFFLLLLPLLQTLSGDNFIPNCSLNTNGNTLLSFGDISKISRIEDAAYNDILDLEDYYNEATGQFHYYYINSYYDEDASYYLKTVLVKETVNITLQQLEAAGTADSAAPVGTAAGTPAAAADAAVGGGTERHVIHRNGIDVDGFMIFKISNIVAEDEFVAVYQHFISDVYSTMHLVKWKHNQEQWMYNITIPNIQDDPVYDQWGNLVGYEDPAAFEPQTVFECGAASASTTSYCDPISVHYSPDGEILVLLRSFEGTKRLLKYRENPETQQLDLVYKRTIMPHIKGLRFWYNAGKMQVLDNKEVVVLLDVYYQEQRGVENYYQLQPDTLIQVTPRSNTSFAFLVFKFDYQTGEMLMMKQMLVPVDFDTTYVSHSFFIKDALFLSNKTAVDGMDLSLITTGTVRERSSDRFLAYYSKIQIDSSTNQTSPAERNALLFRAYNNLQTSSSHPAKYTTINAIQHVVSDSNPQQELVILGGFINPIVASVSQEDVADSLLLLVDFHSGANLSQVTMTTARNNRITFVNYSSRRKHVYCIMLELGLDAYDYSQYATILSPSFTCGAGPGSDDDGEPLLNLTWWKVIVLLFGCFIVMLSVSMLFILVANLTFRKVSIGKRSSYLRLEERSN